MSDRALAKSFDLNTIDLDFITRPLPDAQAASRA